MFRGNSFATKAMDYYMKMVGEEVSFNTYLNHHRHHVLNRPESFKDFEYG